MQPVNPLDSWLRSGPGAFFGRDEQEACENAYAAFIGSGGRLEYHEFVIALDAAGRLPAQQFKNHDTGEFWTRLQLPQRQPDHDGGKRRGGSEDAQRVRRFWSRSEPASSENLDHLDHLE